MPLKSVAVVVLTLNSKAYLQRSLGPLLRSPLNPRVVVVDSSSTDGTVEEAERMGAETVVIPRREFNHGATREFARKYVGTDIVVMMTHDAIPVDEGMIERLVAPIVEDRASIAYARQLPNEGAGFFEAFPRDFNYPAEGHIRSLEDLDRFGGFISFCSDSCAAWSNAALDEIDGFRPTIVHEDIIATAMLLRRGHKIAYAADAMVIHSHCYSLREEFQRYVDIGYARREYRDAFAEFSSAKGHGKKLMRAMLSKLARTAPWKIPYAIANLGTKFLGFRVGDYSYTAPLWFKKWVSDSNYYWKSDAFLAKEQEQTQSVVSDSHHEIARL